MLARAILLPFSKIPCNLNHTFFFYTANNIGRMGKKAIVLSKQLSNRIVAVTFSVIPTAYFLINSDK